MTAVHSLSEDTIERLQDLIRINIDSAKGFREAADTLDDDHVRLRSQFHQLAETRKRFADDLQSMVRSSNEEPADDGTLKGAAHRWWLNLRGLFEGGDAHAILAEAERGEDEIKELYETTLKETADSPAHQVLQSQYRAVKEGHDWVRDLRDAFA